MLANEISSVYWGSNKIIPKTFLPFRNIERFCVERLFDTNSNFVDFLEVIIYPTKVIKLNIIELTDIEFKISDANTDKIKKIFKKLVEELVIYSEKSNTDILNELMNYIYDEVSCIEKYKKLLQELEDFLNK